MAGATPTKPGSATLPAFGVVPQIVDSDGSILEGPGEGNLVSTLFFIHFPSVLTLLKNVSQISEIIKFMVVGKKQRHYFKCLFASFFMNNFSFCFLFVTCVSPSFFPTATKTFK